MDFAVPADHRVKIKAKEKRKILRSCLTTTKAKEHEGDGDTNYIWCIWNDPQRLWELEFGGQAETIQTIALLRSVGILRRFLEI